MEKLRTQIFDKNKIEVKIGDTIVLPYIDPVGVIHRNTADYEAEVVFKYGCVGYYTLTRYEPLMNWMEIEKGEYISNA